MKKVVSIQGQWLGDIAVREAGDISAVVKMAVDNDISVTEHIDAGTELAKPSPVNSAIADYFRVNNLYPTTAIVNDPDTPGGIGYMAVGITFIVS